MFWRGQGAVLRFRYPRSGLELQSKFQGLPRPAHRQFPFELRPKALLSIIIVIVTVICIKSLLATTVGITVIINNASSC